MEYKIRTVFQMLAYCIYPLYKLLNGRIIGNIQYITTDYIELGTTVGKNSKTCREKSSGLWTQSSAGMAGLLG